MTVKFKVLGGGNEIGANSFLLSLDDFNIVIDCGLHPKKSGREKFPDYESIRELKIDHLIITHAHNDHIGALPYFLSFFPHAKIHCTKPTLAITELTLSNTSYLMEKDFKYEWDKSFIKNYSEELLNIIPMIMLQHEFGKKVILNEDTHLIFHESGHLLGAASLEIQYKSKRIFFTGDICFRNQALIPAAKIPNGHFDILISECTNGELDSLPEYSSELKRLAGFVNMISNRGGSILIPTFALGKAQEMLKRLDTLMGKNKIPNLPVYYSPLSKSLNSVYDDFNYTVSRIKPGIKLSEIQTRLLTRRNFSRASFWKKPAIVLVTSGMMIEDTISYRAAIEFLKRSNFGIAVCGYCDPETPGYVIKNADKNSRIFPGKKSTKPIEVLCEIENFSFTSHARREDVTKMISEMNPKTVALIHADESAINKTGEEILKLFPSIKLLSPEKGVEYLF